MRVPGEVGQLASVHHLRWLSPSSWSKFNKPIINPYKIHINTTIIEIYITPWNHLPCIPGLGISSTSLLWVDFPGQKGSRGGCRWGRGKGCSWWGVWQWIMELVGYGIYWENCVRITGFGEVPYSQIKPNHLVPGFMGKIIIGHELVGFSMGCPVKIRGF